MTDAVPNPENGEESITSGSFDSDLPVLTDEQKVKVEKARRFVDEYNKSQHGMNLHPGNSTIHLAALQSMQQAAHMIILCRIYVGSINFELNEQDIRAVFESFGTIRQLNMSLDPSTSKHKGYCFVEYETAEAASLALSTMDGAMLGGRTLKVGRPNNYPATLNSIGLTNAPMERIYVSNVHVAIGEEDLWTIFKVFGEIRAVVLVPNILTGRHKGYGYIEFEQEASATMAVTAMNQFLLGGVTLRVGRAVVGGTLPTGMTGSVYRPKEPLTKPIEDSSSAHTLSSETSHVKEAVVTTPSVIVVLKNMVDSRDIDDDLREDILFECQKFGQLNDMYIHTQEDQVKIFLHYNETHEADNAIHVLNGRWFSGRKICAETYDLSRYLEHDYSG